MSMDPQLLTAEEIVGASVAVEDSRINGVYFLIYGQEVVYVGQASNVLYSILLQYERRYKVFDRYMWIPCPPAMMNDLQASYIVALTPRYNAALPPNGLWATERELRKVLGLRPAQFRRFVRDRTIVDVNGYYRKSEFGL